jgi:hypothetical protein
MDLETRVADRSVSSRTSSFTGSVLSARRQIVEHTKLGGLLFGCALRAGRRARRACEMQRHLPLAGDAIADEAFEFRAQRQHGAEDFSEGSEVVIRDPAAEVQELRIEHRHGVEHADEILDLDGRLAVVQLNHDARHALLTKWDQHAPADNRRGIRRNAVGECHVQRHGQGNVAEFGH